MLPYFSMLTKTFSSGMSSCCCDVLDDPQVGLVEDELVDVVHRQAGVAQGGDRRVGQLSGGVLVDLAPGHLDEVQPPRPLVCGEAGQTEPPAGTMIPS